MLVAFKIHFDSVQINKPYNNCQRLWAAFRSSINGERGCENLNSNKSCDQYVLPPGYLRWTCAFNYLQRIWKTPSSSIARFILQKIFKPRLIAQIDARKTTIGWEAVGQGMWGLSCIVWLNCDWNNCKTIQTVTPSNTYWSNQLNCLCPLLTVIDSSTSKFKNGT